MKPYVSSTHGTNKLRVSIVADNRVDAERYAKNYFGDKSTDFRNRNTVTFVESDYSIVGLNSYIFTVELG
jgi:hypothetical protein